MIHLSAFDCRVQRRSPFISSRFISAEAVARALKEKKRRAAEAGAGYNGAAGASSSSSSSAATSAVAITADDVKLIAAQLLFDLS